MLLYKFYLDQALLSGATAATFPLKNVKYRVPELPFFTVNTKYIYHTYTKLKNLGLV